MLTVCISFLFRQNGPPLVGAGQCLALLRLVPLREEKKGQSEIGFAQFRVCLRRGKGFGALLYLLPRLLSENNFERRRV